MYSKWQIYKLNENSFKTNKKNYNDNFFRSGDQEKEENYISEKRIFVVSGTLNLLRYSLLGKL